MDIEFGVNSWVHVMLEIGLNLNFVIFFPKMESVFQALEYVIKICLLFLYASCCHSCLGKCLPFLSTFAIQPVNSLVFRLHIACLQLGHVLCCSEW